MANEVLIEEYAVFLTKYEDGNFVPIPGELITTQVLDLADMSAQLDARTKMVRLIDIGGNGFWYNIGDTTGNAAATANTDGNRFVPPSGVIDVPIKSGTDNFIDNAAVA